MAVSQQTIRYSVRHAGLACLLALVPIVPTVGKTGPITPSPAKKTVSSVAAAVPDATVTRPDHLTLATNAETEQAVIDALSSHAADLNLPLVLSDSHTLAPVVTKTSKGGVHVYLQQRWHDVPVWRGMVVAHLDRGATRIETVASTLRPITTGFTSDATWSLTANDARSRAAAVVGSPARPERQSRAEQMWVVTGPTSRPVPAWIIHHSSADPLGDWEVVLDAHDGRLLHLDNRLAFVNGTGMVYEPDPLTVAHAEYGDPGYIDNDDATTPQLDNARFERVLNNLSFNGSAYSLTGDWVTLVDFESPFIAPPELTDPHTFLFTRDEDGFEDVNAYYHITGFRQHLALAGLTDLQDSPIEVDAHASGGQDLSYYSPEFNRLGFGTGGVDDAEDPDVITHEYTHALHHDAVGGEVWGQDVRSVAEGLCDFWAADRTQIWDDFHAERVYNWDGHNEFWGGRYVTTPAMYPDQWSDDALDIYTNGTIFAHALWMMRDEFGAWYDSAMVPILIEFFYRLTPGLSAVEIARTLLDAEEALFDNEIFQNQVLNALMAKGFIHGEGSVIGTVTDPVHEVPVEGAQVTLDCQPAIPSVITNAQGRYTIPSAPVGRWTITVTADGYPPVSMLTTVTQLVDTVDAELEPYVFTASESELIATAYIGGQAELPLTLTGIEDNIHWVARSLVTEFGSWGSWDMIQDPRTLYSPPLGFDPVGAAVVADRFYVTDLGTQPQSIRVYSQNGPLVRSFLLPGQVDGYLRGLTSDDEWLWGLDDSDRLMAVDTLGIWRSVIIPGDGLTGTQLAWDRSLPGFWLSSGQDEVHALGLDGELLFTLPIAAPGWDHLLVDDGAPDGWTLLLLSALGDATTVRPVNPVTGDEGSTITVELEGFYGIGGAVMHRLTGWQTCMLLTSPSPGIWQWRDYGLRFAWPWLTATPSWAGGLNSGEQQTTTLTLDGSRLDVGVYETQLRLDPVGPGASLDIPVTFEVIAVDVGDDGSQNAGPGGEIPARLAVDRPFPNPCNASTTLTVRLPLAGEVVLRVYDLLGREVDRISWQQAAGERRVSWVPPADASSGMYLLRVTAPGQGAMTRKVVVVK